MSTLYNNKYDILASTIQPNPASVKYWADLSSNANGGDLKYFDGTKWVLVNNKATEDISTLKQDVETLKESKVDKVEGKQLSTEDFTAALKTSLESLPGEISGKYVKPSEGIPKTDLSSEVQESLNKADSAI